MLISNHQIRVLEPAPVSAPCVPAVYLCVGEGSGAGHAVLHGPRHHREQHQVRLLLTSQLLPAGERLVVTGVEQGERG